MNQMHESSEPPIPGSATIFPHTPNLTQLEHWTRKGLPNRPQEHKEEHKSIGRDTVP
jgi:hypothetical protein